MAQSLVEELEQKNKLLEEELQTLRDLFQNLHEGKGLETPDQRRAFMLKAQNYQLERQCMLLSQAQSSRAAVLTEIECQLQRISGDFESIVSKEKSGPDVTIERKRVMDFLGTFKKLKNSLHKQSQLESSDSLRIPSLMSGSKFSKSQSLNCLDICMLKSPLENLNLKHVASLEQDLSAMYKRLSSLCSLLDSSAVGTDNVFSSASQTLQLGELFLNPTLRRIQCESEKCILDLQHCCDQLMALSLLHPSAPWTAIKRSDSFNDLKRDKIISSLPPSAQKNPQIRTVLQSTCKAHNYVTHMHRLKQDAVASQLEFHKVTAKIQQQYLAELSSMLVGDYLSWKEGTVDKICQPIAMVLKTWTILKDNQSSENLKGFLDDFKKYETELEKVSMMELSDDKTSKDDLFSGLKMYLDKKLKCIATDYEDKISKAEKAIKQHRPA